MPEIFKEAIGLHNLPVTVLLVVMIVYWLMVVIGVVDGDMDGADAGADAGLDVDAGADAGVHADTGHAGDFGDVHSSQGGITVGGHLEGHASHGQNGGFWQSCGRLLHLGEIPLMIVLSVLSLFMWFFSVTANVLWNGAPGDRSPTVALLLLLPNLLLSLLLTRMVLSPLRSVIKKMQSSESEVEQVLGREGIVCTSELSDSFGQIEIPAKGVPVVVNARLAPGSSPVPRGTPVIVYAAAPDAVYYLVRPAAAAD